MPTELGGGGESSFLQDERESAFLIVAHWRAFESMAECAAWDARLARSLMNTVCCKADFQAVRFDAHAVAQARSGAFVIALHNVLAIRAVADVAREIICTAIVHVVYHHSFRPLPEEGHRHQYMNVKILPNAILIQ